MGPKNDFLSKTSGCNFSDFLRKLHQHKGLKLTEMIFVEKFSYTVLGSTGGSKRRFFKLHNKSTYGILQKIWHGVTTA